ncbi:MAG: archaemetzincin family Zn-dependent metalloprotease [Deltaproteobacteria bacterium]
MLHRIQLLPIGDVDRGLLDSLCNELSASLRAQCESIHTFFFDPEPARHPARGQYFSTELLARMKGVRTPAAWRLLGLTRFDLYIPTLTFVFGEAQLEGSCAVVSLHRLRQEFYGLPPDPQLLKERLLKEAVHELGHTLKLRHCDDYRCVMAPSHSVEWVDLKSSSFCPACLTEAAHHGLIS